MKVKFFGEEHPDNQKVTLLSEKRNMPLGYFSSALQSYQRALDIRVKLFGEEHPDTAESYFSLGVTQHAPGDLLSAL